MSTKVDGRYQNMGPKEELLSNTYDTVKKFLFSKNLRPDSPIENVVDDYMHLKNDEFVWFGHSSVLFRTHNLTFFVDPIFYDIPGMSVIKPQFKMQHEYDLAAFPEIDYLLLTHNHYDHLSIKTLKQLKPKIKRVICPLDNMHYIDGIFDRYKITELDWLQTVQLSDTVKIRALPGKHFTSRTGLDSMKALWAGYQVNDILVSGDTSYNEKLGRMLHDNLLQPVRIAFVEFGQYNVAWKSVHMLPENVKLYCDQVSS